VAPIENTYATRSASDGRPAATTDQAAAEADRHQRGPVIGRQRCIVGEASRPRLRIASVMRRRDLEARELRNVRG